MIAEAPTTPASSCHSPADAAPEQCFPVPHSPTHLPTSSPSQAPSLLPLALALLQTDHSYEQIAADHHISLDALLAFLDDERFQSLLARIAALENLRRQQRLAASIERAVARLQQLCESSEDPVEQRRNATAITRTRPVPLRIAPAAARSSPPARTSPDQTARAQAAPHAAPPQPPATTNATTNYPPDAARHQPTAPSPALSDQDVLTAILLHFNDNEDPPDRGLRVIHNFLSYPFRARCPLAMFPEYCRKKLPNLINFDSASMQPVPGNTPQWARYIVTAQTAGTDHHFSVILRKFDDSAEHRGCWLLDELMPDSFSRPPDSS